MKWIIKCSREIKFRMIRITEFVDKLEEILGTSVFRGMSYARDLA